MMGRLMNIIRLRSLAVVLAGVLIGLAANPGSGTAAILEVTGGQLTGAIGVNIGGSFFDVEFVDGTCGSVFPDCNDPSDFDFDSGTALVAAQALLDQVFIDGPDGNFDSDPTLTSGCIFADWCTAYVPYEVSSTTLTHAAAFNYKPGSDPFFDAASVGGGFPVGLDLGPNGANAVFADFSVSAVPLPAAFPLMGSGLALLGFMGWRRKRSAAA